MCGIPTTILVWLSIQMVKLTMVKLQSRIGKAKNKTFVMQFKIILYIVFKIKLVNISIDF